MIAIGSGCSHRKVEIELGVGLDRDLHLPSLSQYRPQKTVRDHDLPTVAVNTSGPPGLDREYVKEGGPLTNKQGVSAFSCSTLKSS